MSTPSMEEAVAEIADFRFESGQVLPTLRIAYVRQGALNAARSNLLLVMPGTGNTRHSALGHVGPGLAYDTDHYCVVCTDGIGGGGSSRPSEGLRGGFPRYTIRDMAHAHHRLARECLGLGDTPVAVVAGASMGAFQALEYVVHYPQHARRAVLLVPAGRASTLFQTVVERLTEIVRLDPDWQEGRYVRQPEQGLRAAGRHYFPWTVSDAWIDALDTAQARAACDAAGAWFAQWDAWDLVRRYETSAAHDVGLGFGGDTQAALSRVQAETLVLACEEDRLLGLAQARRLADGIPGSTFRTFSSPKGHLAWKAEPGSPQTREVTRAVRAFLGLSSCLTPRRVPAPPVSSLGEG